MASTRWASEERRKGEGRTGAGTGACIGIRSVPSACTHQQAPLGIPRRRLLRSTRARACARARVTRWAPPRPMNHLLTTYHISTSTRPPLTCGPNNYRNNYPSPVPISVHTWSSSTHQSAATQEEPQQAAAAVATRPLPATITNPTPPHYRPTHQHPPTPQAPCPSTTPGISEAGTRVRAPGGSSTHAPSAPILRVRVEGAYFALGPSKLHYPRHSNTPNAKKSPLHPHPFGWGQRGRL